MKTAKNFSVKDRVNSFRHAFNGMGIVLLTQHNAWIHLVCTLIALGLSYGLNIGRIKFCIVVIAVCTVWGAEALNTTCEILVNMVSPSYSARARRAKDVGAAAVLVTAVGALVVGIVIFGPPLLEILYRHRPGLLPS